MPLLICPQTRSTRNVPVLLSFHLQVKVNTKVHSINGGQLDIHSVVVANLEGIWDNDMWAGNVGADEKRYRRVCGYVGVLAGNEGVDGQGKEGCDGSKALFARSYSVERHAH
jgi:hypothetical protein